MKEPKHACMGKEFPHTDSILPLSALAFTVIWVLDSFVFGFSAEFTGFIPDSLRMALFIGLEISAVALGFSSHNALFSEKHKEPALITDGVFAYVRHPLYLSILLAYLGFVVASMSILSLATWFCYVILYDKMATYEEEDLVRILGDTYLKYRMKVPKWIPNLFSPRT